MFFHFRELVSVVVDFFKHIIPLIESYHAKQKNQTLDVIQKFVSGDNERLVRKCLMKSDEGDSIPLKNQTYSVYGCGASEESGTCEALRRRMPLGIPALRR